MGLRRTLGLPLLAIALVPAALIARPSVSAADPADQRGTGQRSTAPPTSTATASKVVVDGDQVVVGVPTPDGYTLAAPGAAGGWTTLALLRVAGWDTTMWTGSTCTTTDGRFAAATFAPAEVANDPVLRDRGAFAAVVRVADGDVWIVPERVSLKYHTPGCGHHGVVFSRNPGSDQEQTELLRVDPASQAIVERELVDEQVTSAIPVGDGIVAAAGRRVVEIDHAGPRVLASGPGQVFELRPGGGEQVDFLSVDGTDGVVAFRLAGGVRRETARGSLGQVALAYGRGGATKVVGRPTWTSGALPTIAAAADDVVSLDGGTVVEESSTTGGDDSTPRIRSRTRGGPSTEAPVVDDPDRDAGQGRTRQVRQPAPLTAVTSTPKCAVPRSDYTVQVVQPTPQQTEWAAHRAVRGELTITRPANWNNNGLGSYSPQSLFPRPALSGGGRMPVQVLLGILAAESNLSEAAWSALPGIPGNPLVGDYYGTVYNGSGQIVGMNFSNADCGYGIAQVTDGMTAASTLYTATQKKAIATDYAANMAAAVRILHQKWNQAWSQGLLANGGDPTKIENWYFVIWGYNTGIYDPGAAGAPYGVGWTNNPANADYKPDRNKFLRTTYDDAASPWKWPYQERVFGWAESPQLDYQGNRAYHNLAAWLDVPQPYTFCDMTVNDCDPNDTSGSTTAFCTRSDRKCWWHGAKSWFYASGTVEEANTYQSGAAEPAGTNPHPPACTPVGERVPSNPELTGLPATAVIVDDLPNSQWNLVGCPAVPNPGSFLLNFATDGSGNALSAIDFHQIGAGYLGHFYFSHTVDPARTAMKATGTWTPPSTAVGWQKIFVHIPDHGADTYQADYRIWTGTAWYHRVVNQRWNQNLWVDLGAFQLSSGAKVELSNTTWGDYDHGLPGDIRPIDIAWDAVAFVGAAKPSVSYVAMGDSYSAGEGVEPYLENSDVGKNTANYKNACHRSPQAYSNLVYDQLRTMHPGVSEFHFVACSGAEIPDLLTTEQSGEVPVLDQGWLDENTTHITISIGGNDAGFGDILKACVVETGHNCLAPDFYLTRSSGDTDPQPLTDYEPQVIDGLQDNLETALEEIKLRAPNAQVLLVGYPNVMYPGDERGVCNVVYTDDIAQWFANMVSAMAVMMQNAATAAGVDYVYAVPTFMGHEACTSVGEEWINAMIAESDTGSGVDHPGSGTFHPKARGHVAYRDIIVPELD
ncbi:MAG: hypothetical protein JWN67_3920 [Actinomycetia bacterium]|nr:hypothetical protein [Actinomycetes bacterium]